MLRKYINEELMSKEVFKRRVTRETSTLAENYILISINYKQL